MMKRPCPTTDVWWSCVMWLLVELAALSAAASQCRSGDGGERRGGDWRAVFAASTKQLMPYAAAYDGVSALYVAGDLTAASSGSVRGALTAVNTLTLTVAWSQSLGRTDVSNRATNVTAVIAASNLVVVACAMDIQDDSGDDDDVVVVWMDSNGTFLSGVSVQKNNKVLSPAAMAMLLGGSVLVAANVQTDVVLARLERGSTAELVWRLSYGNPNRDFTVVDVSVDLSSSRTEPIVFLCGTTEVINDNDQGNDMYVLRVTIRSTATIDWTRFSAVSGAMANNGNDVHAVGVIYCSPSVVVVGNIQPGVGVTKPSVVVASLNAQTGDLLWTKVVRGHTTSTLSRGLWATALTNVTKQTSSLIIIAATLESVGAVLIGLAASNGDLQWMRTVVDGTLSTQTSIMMPRFVVAQLLVVDGSTTAPFEGQQLWVVGHNTTGTATKTNVVLRLALPTDDANGCQEGRCFTSNRTTTMREGVTVEGSTNIELKISSIPTIQSDTTFNIRSHSESSVVSPAQAPLSMNTTAACDVSSSPSLSSAASSQLSRSATSSPSASPPTSSISTNTGAVLSHSVSSTAASGSGDHSVSATHNNASSSTGTLVASSTVGRSMSNITQSPTGSSPNGSYSTTISHTRSTSLRTGTKTASATRSVDCGFPLVATRGGTQSAMRAFGSLGLCPPPRSSSNVSSLNNGTSEIFTTCVLASLAAPATFSFDGVGTASAMSWPPPGPSNRTRFTATLTVRLASFPPLTPAWFAVPLGDGLAALWGPTVDDEDSMRLHVDTGAAASNVSIKAHVALLFVLLLSSPVSGSTMHFETPVVLRCEGYRVLMSVVLQWPHRDLSLASEVTTSAATAAALTLNAADVTMAVSTAMLTFLSCSAVPPRSSAVAYVLSAFFDLGYAAMAIGNALLIVLVLALHIAVFLALQHRGKRRTSLTEPAPRIIRCEYTSTSSSSTLSRLRALASGNAAHVSRARFPSVSISAAALLAPGSVFGAAAALAQGSSALHVVAAVFGLLLSLLLAVVIPQMLLRKVALPLVTFVPYAPRPLTGPQWEQLLLYPAGRWAPPKLSRAFRPLIAPMRAAQHCPLLGAEVALGLLLAGVTGAILGGGSVSGGAACGAGPIVVALSQFVYAVVLMILRPHRLPMDRVCCPLCHVLLGTVCTLKYVAGDDEGINALAIDLQQALACVQLWKALWAAYVVWYRERAHRISERTAERCPTTDTTTTMQQLLNPLDDSLDASLSPKDFLDDANNEEELVLVENTGSQHSNTTSERAAVVVDKRSGVDDIRERPSDVDDDQEEVLRRHEAQFWDERGVARCSEAAPPRVEEDAEMACSV